MDVIFKHIKCDRTLPIWVIDDSFSFTCNGKKRCRFSNQNIAEMSGKLVMNGYEDYVQDDTKVGLVGTFETISYTYDIDQVFDICKLNNANQNDNEYNQVDDQYYSINDDAVNQGDDGKAGDDFYNDDVNVQAYGDDDAYADDDDDAYAGDDAAVGDDAAARFLNGDDAAYAAGCPASGIYDFTAYMRLQNGKWTFTGFGATGSFEMFTRSGTMIGKCSASFRTVPVSPFLLPASVCIGIGAILLGVVLFYGVYFLIKKEMLCCASDGACGSYGRSKRSSRSPRDYSRHYENMDETDDDDSSFEEVASSKPKKIAFKFRRPGDGKAFGIHENGDMKESGGLKDAILS
jgi:hypothetical protein